MRLRDGFSATTKRLLAARAGHVCSNPGCRVPTSGPQADVAGAVNVGVAAHITAASPGGARYDGALSAQERASSANGIWLCQTCAHMIDHDVRRFDASALRGWKRNAETAAQEAIGHKAADLQRPAERLRVCGFDLDGTLIRGAGFRYSWQAVWHKLGFEDDLRRTLFRRYERGAMTYAQWCAECAFYFRQRRISEATIREVAADLAVTRHLDEGVAMLRNAGLAVGIISGGIDALLDVMIPNHRDLFDFVHINRFRFDDRGELVEIHPTPYDFQGKLDGLEAEAALRGCTLGNCAFVGEGGNDRHLVQAMHDRAAGLTIAYPPTSADVELWADRCVDEDDLRVVAEQVIAHG